MNRAYRRIAVVLAGVLGATIGVSSPAQAEEIRGLRWEIAGDQDEISDYDEDNETDQKALALELAQLADEQDERDQLIADLREQEATEGAEQQLDDSEPSGESAPDEPVEGVEPGTDGVQTDDIDPVDDSAPDDVLVAEEPTDAIPSEESEANEPEEHVVTGLTSTDAGSGAAAKSDGVFAPAEAKPSLFLNNPLNYMYVTSNYGLRYHPTLHYTRLHAGTDFRAPCGTAVLAAQSGIVLSAKWNGSGGNTVMIDHGSNGEHNIKTRYLHLSKMQVSAGQAVSMGDQIGLSGMTGGISTGCHLHFEVLIDDETVNPLTQLQYELPPPLTLDPPANPFAPVGTD